LSGSRRIRKPPTANRARSCSAASCAWGSPPSPIFAGAPQRTPELADLCKITDRGTQALASGIVTTKVAEGRRAEEAAQPAPTVPSPLDERALDALSEDSKQWKRLEEGLDDETCQALIARIRALGSEVRRLEGIAHYYKCPCGARVPRVAAARTAWCAI